MKKALCAVVASTIIGLTGCSPPPRIERPIQDYTGDGIPDVVVAVPNHATWLFVGQKDGSYIRALQKETSEGIKYFISEHDDQIYFYDGEFYRPSPKYEQDS